ncbi:MAG: glycosyltransferase family 4 protein [Coriobacteriia bacterium]|nr:glycosyltransferase family 4 protein [Coriobacteriia bacterium]
MRVLITNYCLISLSGTELYVRDIALELRRQGHTPVVYASWLGKTAEDLSLEGIPVTSSLNRLDFQPDIIHGHHLHETLSAVLRFPGVPALFVCHSHTRWTDKPPLHSRVLRYFGVSGLCVERLRALGAPGDRIGQLYNFVDLERFRPRPPLPEKPLRALVFSNYAASDTYLPAVAEACRSAGIELSVVGAGVGNSVERPEEILGRYDIVFAKAKAALEAMAVGCAVVLCDFGGVGPMVTSSTFEDLRPLNFGFQSLTETHTPENLLRQIERYDPRDAERVSTKLRACAGLNQAVVELTDIYRQTIDEYRSRPVSGGLRDIACRAAEARFRLTYGVLRLWRSIPQEKRQAINNHHGLGAIKRGIQLVLCGRAR